MKLKNRLPAVLAVLLTLLVAAAGLWAPRALFAAGDAALYTTHATTRTGGSLAVRPEDLPLVQALRGLESLRVNGGYQTSYDNTWEAPDEVLRRMRELADPLVASGAAGELNLDVLFDTLSIGNASTMHTVSSSGVEHLSAYGMEPGARASLYLSVEMGTGLLTTLELRDPAYALPGNPDMAACMRAFVDYLGLSVFTDWALLTAGNAQTMLPAYDPIYSTGLLYSEEAKLAVYCWSSDSRGYVEPGSLWRNLWVDSYALDPGLPQRWRDEQGADASIWPPPPASSVSMPAGGG